MEWTVLGVMLTVGIAYKMWVKLTTGMCKCKTRMDGKTVLITGANTGIGKEMALDMAKRGARVILACRDVKKANAAKEEIISVTGNKSVSVVALDLASLTSVRECAREVLASEQRLDVLVNNAGLTGLEDKLSEDGLQTVLQINHYAPFLLTNLLIDLMKKSAPSRIIFVASMNHRLAKFDHETFDTKLSIFSHQSYNCSKLYNVLTSNALAEKLKGTGVTVNSLHPGVVYTEIWRGLPFLARCVINTVLRYCWKTVNEGAQTTIHLAVAEELQGVTGKYFVDCKETLASATARDKDLAKKLWKKSEERVKLSSLKDSTW